jgi:predicted ATP-grasp superfamily ATP-dependent carboligase
MRVFVYEYICGGGLAGRPLPTALQREGWAMLTAVLEDCRRCPDLETVTLLDSRLAVPADWSGTAVTLVEPGAERELFCERARPADFTLVIAPEFDYLLYQRCCWTEEIGGRLLGPSSPAVHLTGDKLRLGDVWRRNSIPTPPILPYPEGCIDISYPVVCKPRRGAGSRGMFLAKSFQELLHNRSFRSEGIQDEPLVQSYVRGIAASVSLLIGGGWCLALPAATQHLSDDGRFRYLGGTLPLPDDFNDRAQKLALRAIAPISGLAGYVGVDLILGNAADGSEDFAIEINPRLTTSYVGLRQLAEFNLAETMLSMALGKPLPKRTYREGIVRFQADGTGEMPEVQ